MHQTNFVLNNIFLFIFLVLFLFVSICVLFVSFFYTYIFIHFDIYKLCSAFNQCSSTFFCFVFFPKFFFIRSSSSESNVLFSTFLHLYSYFLLAQSFRVLSIKRIYKIIYKGSFLPRMSCFFPFFKIVKR